MYAGGLCRGSPGRRTGPAVALPNGPARNDCEREDWYELAPARVRATGATAGVLVDTYYSQQVDGLAVFRPQQNDPEELEHVWPKIDEPALQRKHQAHIDPVDAAHQRVVLWSVGGLALGFTGLGIAAAVQDQDRSAATAAGVTGLAALLIGAIGALSSQPSGEAQLHADARRRLFIEGEDDRAAIERGVNTANSRRRRQCGGTPAPPPVSRSVHAPAPIVPPPDVAGERTQAPPDDANTEPDAPRSEEQAPSEP